MILVICILLAGCDKEIDPGSANSDRENNFFDAQSNNHTTTNSKLSNTCDKVFASGYDGQNNFFELVANETEDYTGLVTYIGVIKNNEWLLEPTTNIPLNNENGAGTLSGDFYYIGNHCFLREELTLFDPDHGHLRTYIVYNFETGESHRVADTRKRIPIPTNCDDEYMIIDYDSSVRHGSYGHADEYITEFLILNTTNMTTHTITVSNDLGYLHDYSNISEGLFAVGVGRGGYILQSDISYSFYDINGNKVLDLSEYKTKGLQTLNFVNGLCSLEIINDNDSKYKITFDKTGTVIDSEKIN